MNLYAGTVLVVNLTEGTVTKEPLRSEWLRQYWGCWGLALRYFWEHVSPDVKPLSPGNAFVIMTGPLCGTLAPLTSRFCLVSKSPHTGTVFESNAGGAFGPALKFAGYDGIVVTGRADRPSYLRIVDDQVSIENAEDIWGKGIFETERALKQAVSNPEAETLAIGPAGENLITYACVGTSAYRQLGRGGAGALFGSKNLKAIVCTGSGAVRVADMGAFLDKVEQHKREHLFVDEQLVLAKDGTPELIHFTNEAGMLPTRNYTRGSSDGVAQVNADTIRGFKLGDRACSSCPIACGKFTSADGVTVEGPEYETAVVGGINCAIHDMGALIHYNAECDDLGIDTMSTGATIGLAMDLTESGVHDFGLRFGETEGYLAVLREIAELSTERGRDLAAGARQLAAKYGVPDRAPQVKGMEFAAFEPRANYGVGLGYATSERGACHLRALPIVTEDPFDLEKMAREVAEQQNFNGIKWSLCFCDLWFAVNLEIMADLLDAGLGETVTTDELALAGERVWNLTRLFNVGAGFTAADDTLPGKFMKDALKSGPQDGRVFGREDFEAALARYYALRGWDETGVPSNEKLAELGMTELTAHG